MRKGQIKLGGGGTVSSLETYAAQNSLDVTMVRSHMESTLGGGKLFHIWQMFTVFQRLCR